MGAEEGVLWNEYPGDRWNGPGTWNEIGKVLIKQVLARHSASFTMFLEDPMDWALYQDTLEVGNHGELGKHSCGYLDGHADYAYRDTYGWCGVGWEAINPDWVRTIESTPRPVAYANFFVNCYPPSAATDGTTADSAGVRPRYNDGLRVRPSPIPDRTGGEQ
jgi:hypothetical protein